MKPRRNLFLGSLLVFAFGAVSSAFAATVYWDGVTGNWSDVANWSTASGATTPNPGTVPTGGDTAIFNITTVDGDQTVYLDGDRGSGSRIALQFDNTGTTQLLGGTSASAANNILYTQGITINAGAGAVTIGDTAGSPTRRVDIQTGSHSFTNNSSSLFTIANGIRSVGTGSTSTFTFTGTGNTSILGQVNNGTGSNVVAITKTGTGTLTLAGNNIHSAATTISNGVVNIQHANALGTVAAGTSVASGAALQIQGGITTLAEALSLNGTGISATGALRNISGNNSYAGLVTLAGATRINSDSGTLTLSNTGTITGATFGLTVGGAGNTTINSIIGTTTGTLTKDGAGILSLTRANTYSGQTTLGVSYANSPYVNDGILRISNGSALGSGTLRINGGYQTASLELTGGITVTNAITLEGRQGISGNGPISNLSGDNTISGDINLVPNGARIIFGSQAGKLTVSGNTFTGASGRTLNLIGDGDGEMAKSVLTANFNSVEKSSGSGTWTLSGANTYATATTVTAGTLAVSGSGTLGNGASLTVNGGALDLGTSSQTVGAVSVSAAAASGDTIRNGSLTGTSYAASNAAGNAIISANLLVNGSAGFTKTGAGTVTLSGTNTYTGLTTVDHGTLFLNTTGGGAIAGNITLSSTAAARTYLRLQQNNQIAATSVLTMELNNPTSINSNVYAEIALQGNSQTLAGINATWANGIGSGSNIFIENRVFGDNGGGDGVLTINGAADSNWGSRVLVRDGASGTLSLAKDGNGTLTLGGSNTYTGTTTISGGVVKAGHANALGGITNGTTINTGGTFDFNGFALAGETFDLAGGKLTNTGAQQLNAINGDATVTANSSIGGDTRWDFRASGASLTVNNGVTLTKVDDNVIAAVARTVTNNGTIQIDDGVFAFHTAGTYGGAGNYVVNPGGELQLGGYGAASTVTLSNAITSNGGILSAVDSSGTGGAPVFSGDVSLASSTTTTLRADANGIVSGKLSGSGNLTKTGNGIFSLTGDNSSYSGVTTVSTGILSLGHADAMGASSSVNVTSGATLRVDTASTGSGRTVTINGSGSGFYGALQGLSSTSVTWAGNVELGSNEARIGGGEGGTLTIGGVISDGGNGHAVLFSRAPNSTTVLDNVNTYTGDTLLFPNSSTVTLKMGIANAIDSNSRIRFSASVTGTANIDLNGYSQNIRALVDTQAANMIVTNSGTSDAVLTLSESNAANNATFDGWIEDGATNKVSLVKTGAGTQILSGANTYTGTTSVTGGKLVIGTTGSLAAASAVSVSNAGSELVVDGTVGGTLLANASTIISGSGTVSGAAEIRGTHNPGNSPGIQTFSTDLSYKGGSSVVNWELGLNTDVQGSPTAAFDQIIVGGDLDFTDLTTLNLVFNASGSGVLWANTFWDTDQTWTIYDVAGSTTNFSNLSLNTTNWADSGTNLFGTVRPDASFSLSLSGNDVLLNYVVPEPSTALLGGLSALLLLRRRRD